MRSGRCWTPEHWPVASRLSNPSSDLAAGMTTHDDIPTLKPPDQMLRVRKLADLERHWRALMGLLGSSERLLWMLFLEADGRMAPMISQIAELPGVPDEEVLGELMEISDRVCVDMGSGSVAFLLSHPGSAGVTATDRVWAQPLARAANKAGVAMSPMHAADNQVLRPVTPDDLVESQSA